MGVAGAEDRGVAHYRWAERHAKRGKLDKALAQVTARFFVLLAPAFPV